jgi:hypothetical protein
VNLDLDRQPAPFLVAVMLALEPGADEMVMVKLEALPR